MTFIGPQPCPKESPDGRLEDTKFVGLKALKKDMNRLVKWAAER